MKVIVILRKKNYVNGGSYEIVFPEENLSIKPIAKEKYMRDQEN